MDLSNNFGDIYDADTKALTLPFSFSLDYNNYGLLEANATTPINLSALLELGARDFNPADIPALAENALRITADRNPYDLVNAGLASLAELYAMVVGETALLQRSDFDLTDEEIDALVVANSVDLAENFANALTADREEQLLYLLQLGLVTANDLITTSLTPVDLTPFGLPEYVFEAVSYINVLIGEGIVSLEDLVSDGIVTVADLAAMDRVSAAELVNDYNLATMEELAAANLLDAAQTVDLRALLAAPEEIVTLNQLIERELITLSDFVDRDISLGLLDISNWDLEKLLSAGVITQSLIDLIPYDPLRLLSNGIDLGLDLGPLEIIADISADLQASVGASFDLIIDLDGATGTEGFSVLIDDAELTGDVAFDLPSLSDANEDGIPDAGWSELGVRLGFVELTTDAQIHLDAQASLTLDDPTGPMAITSLLNGSALSNLDFDFGGEAWAILEGLQLSGSSFEGINLAEGKQVGIFVQDLTQWDNIEVIQQEGDETILNVTSQTVDGRIVRDVALAPSLISSGRVDENDVAVVIPDLENILDLSEMSFADIIRAIDLGVDVLSDMLAGMPFYEQVLPIINRAPADLFESLPRNPRNSPKRWLPD